MKDLTSEGIERLLDTDASSFERGLLEAGARERPSPELLLAMQRGLGIAPDVAPAQGEPSLPEPAAAPAATTGGSAAWSSATLLKLGIGATLGAGVVIAALSLPSRPAEPAPASVPREVATAAPAEVSALPSSAPPSSALPAPETPALAPDPARELRLEIEQLDRARSALSSSQPERALGLLDEYAARFPAGTLAREAQLLRDKIGRGDTRQRAKLRAAPDRATLEAPAPTPARP